MTAGLRKQLYRPAAVGLDLAASALVGRRTARAANGVLDLAWIGGIRHLDGAGIPHR